MTGVQTCALPILDAAAASSAFARLVLLDPVIHQPAYYTASRAASISAQDHPVARRKNTFDSVAAFAERLAGRASFPRFTPTAFEDYCSHALVETDGRLRLACPPLCEAQVYLTGASNPGIIDSVNKLDIPALVVRAQRSERLGMMDFSVSPTWPGLAAALSRGRDMHWQDCSLSIPMERPQAVAGLIRAEIGQLDR